MSDFFKDVTDTACSSCGDNFKRGTGIKIYYNIDTLDRIPDYIAKRKIFNIVKVYCRKCAPSRSAAIKLYDYLSSFEKL